MTHTITIPALDQYGRVSEVEVAKLFSKMVNVMSKDGAEFAEAIINDHRTLIQKSMAVMFTAIVKLADDADKGYFDLRDEQAAKLSQKLRDVLVEEGVFIKDGVVKLSFI